MRTALAHDCRDKGLPEASLDTSVASNMKSDHVHMLYITYCVQSSFCVCMKNASRTRIRVVGPLGPLPWIVASYTPARVKLKLVYRCVVGGLTISHFPCQFLLVMLSVA